MISPSLKHRSQARIALLNLVLIWALIAPFSRLPDATASPASPADPAAPLAGCAVQQHSVYLPQLKRAAGDPVDEEGGDPNEVGVEPRLAAEQARLAGVSEHSFAALDSQVRFELSCSSFSANPAATSLTVNGQPLVAATVDTALKTLSFAPPLVDGANHIVLDTSDRLGAALSNDVVIWAGSHTLEVSLVDDQNDPVSGVAITATLAQDPQVHVVATSTNGLVRFANLPAATLFLSAAAGERVASATVSGDDLYASLALRGPSATPPSPVANNDFSQGADGWDIGSAAVTIVPHVEGSPAPRPNRPAELAAAQAARGAKPALDPALLELAMRPATPSAPAASPGAADMDLVIATSDEGPQTVGRTFATQVGTHNVLLRFRFVTSEVVGGYFGTVYDDAFEVKLRSRGRGTVVSLANSMNGLGLSAFDPGGATEWYEVVVPVDPAGDTVEIAATISNVRDGLLNSQLILDALLENNGPFVSIGTFDGKLPAVPAAAGAAKPTRLKVISRGGLDANVRYAYQWFRSSGQSAADYQPIASTSTYTVTNGDVGHRLFLRMSDPAGHTADSNIIAVGPTAAPVIKYPSGELRVEQPYFSVANVKHNEHTPANPAGSYTYEIQVGLDKTFKSLVYSSTMVLAELSDNSGISYARLPQALPQTTAAKPYHWRARALVGGAPGPWVSKDIPSFYINDVWSAQGDTWHWPVKDPYDTVHLSGTFMESFHAKIHGGMDIPVPDGTPVYAVRNGVLIDQKQASGWITLEHADQHRETLYRHMKSVNSKDWPVGTMINQGTLIGKSSNTGTVAYHLHFEFLDRAGKASAYTYLNPLAVTWEGWTPPASLDPQVTGIYLRGDRTLLGSKQRNLGPDVYVLARTVDPALMNPSKSGERLVPYATDFFINGSSVYTLRLDSFAAGLGISEELKYYAYDKIDMRGNFLPPGAPNNPANLAKSTNWDPYVLYYKWRPSNLPLGPQTIRVVAADFLGKTGALTATIGPQLQPVAPVVINACPAAPAETAVPITLTNRNANLAGNVSDTYTVTLTPGATLSGLKVPANGNPNQVTMMLGDGKSNSAANQAITLLIKKDTPAGTIRLTATSGILAQIKHAIDIQVQVVRPGC